MLRIDLQDVAADLAGNGPATQVYLSIQTGECCPVTDGSEDMWEDFDFEEDHWVVLPDSHDRNEWNMMRLFAESRATGKDRERLLRAIRGRGAFRVFKDAAHDLGLLDAWYTHLHDETVEIVRAFLQASGVEFEDKDKDKDEGEGEGEDGSQGSPKRSPQSPG